MISEARSLGSSLGTLILEGMGCRHPTALRPTCRKATCCPRVSGPAGLLLTALADSRVRKPARTSRPGEPPCICSPATCDGGALRDPKQGLPGCVPSEF